MNSGLILLIIICCGMIPIIISLNEKKKNNSNHKLNSSILKSYWSSFIYVIEIYQSIILK